jgi:hypothetical protein
MADYKPRLCVDFDGVLHSYKSGWQGAHVCADPPVPGAIAFLREATEHFEVYVHSSRSHQKGGRDAMRAYLLEWAQLEGDEDLMWLNKIRWPNEKPAAFVTLDDRAICFTGTFPSVEEIKNFKPWNKK